VSHRDCAHDIGVALSCCVLRPAGCHPLRQFGIYSHSKNLPEIKKEMKS
jgi:hypothetical protein